MIRPTVRLGAYSVPEGIAFSFPVTMRPNGCFEICEDIPCNDDKLKALDECIQVRLSSELYFVYLLKLFKQERLIPFLGYTDGLGSGESRATEKIPQVRRHPEEFNKRYNLG